jgi:plasmid stabilization system protein ParE
VKIVFTEPALSDLDEITDWLKQHYPGLGRAMERRLERNRFRLNRLTLYLFGEA